jgi:hypothetical protein
MMVNAAVFTCSICGEASLNICSYCTKDACSNHRCERCKRCSDCCECEFPLSAEEPVAVEEAPVAVAAERDSVLEPQLEATESEAPQPEAPEPEAASPRAESYMAGFLTPEESSVFAEESVVTEAKVFDESSIFAPEDPEELKGEEPEATDMRDHGDPTEPRW